MPVFKVGCIYICQDYKRHSNWTQQRKQRHRSEKATGNRRGGDGAGEAHFGRSRNPWTDRRELRLERLEPNSGRNLDFTGKWEPAVDLGRGRGMISIVF